MPDIEILKERAALIQAVRSFFINQGYLEVDTPIRIPAPAPEAYIEPVETDGWFLQTSPELCMKRLLAAGCGKIFQICKCFRKNERGRQHLPEMTMLEWYRRDSTYFDLMSDCEELLRFLRPGGGLLVTQNRLDIKVPWQRLSLAEAFSQHASISLEQAITDHKFEEVLVSEVEPNLGLATPTFIYDFPPSLASLARLAPDNPKIAQRFELYIAGIEIANGFSELNDAREQRQRFINEQAIINKLGRLPAPLPEPFLNDLEHMPEAAGIALGLDRLIMVLSGAESIDKVVAFTPEDL